MKISKLGKFFLIVFAIVLLFSVFAIGRVLASEPLFKLSNATIIDKSSGVEAAIEDFSNNELITNTTFHKIDDYVKYSLTIKNTSNSKYTLLLVNDNNASDNVTYEYEYDKDEEVAPNSSVEVVLKITYNNGVTEINKRTQDQEVKISFILADEEGNVISDDITNNPQTSDNIWIYIITALVSLIGLILIIYKKKPAKLFILIILLLPVITYAVSSSLVITLKNNTNLYDKILVNKVVNGENQAIIVDYNDTVEKPADPVVAGYEFDGWYVGDEEYNFDTPLTEDMVLKAKLTPIVYTISYDYDGGVDQSNPTTYNVETESFDLVNPTKEGYTFAGWTGSNGTNLQTRVTIEKGSTGNKSYVAHYSASENTPYKVNHKYKKLDGTFTTETEELTGPTNETVYPAVRSKTGFENPEVKSLTILADGSAYIDYEYERKEYTLTIQSSEYVETTFTEDKYPYETEITLTAKAREHYNFVKWSNNSTNNPVTFKLTENTTIGPVYQVKQYTVSFDARGGVDPDDLLKDYNTPIGNLPQTTRDDYVFDGWWTEASGGTEIDETTLVTGDITYYAHWSKSISLATVTPASLNLTRGENATISVKGAEEEYTFTSSNTDVVTVNNSGVVVAQGKGSTTITIEGTRSHATKTVTITVNPIMYNITFDARGGTGGTTVSKEENVAIGTLPNSTKDDYVFAGWWTEASGGTQIDETLVVTETKTYYAHWLKSMSLATVSPDSITITRLQTATITVSNVEEEYTFTSADPNIATVDANGEVTGKGKGSTTITIEGTGSHVTKTVTVTVNPIMYDITFDARGGTGGTTVSKEENVAIGTLPNTTKDDCLFDGWFTEASGGTQIDDTLVVTETKTYYAHWTKTVALATVSPDSVTVTRLQTQTITVSNVDEEYTFTSANPNIATVSDSGVVTGAGKGSTTITIEGTRSHATKTVNVTVNPIMYTVSFDSDGGGDFADKSIEENTAVGSLPIPEKADYNFVGWYTEDGSTKVTDETIIESTITFVAHWDKILCKKAQAGTLHTETCNQSSSSTGCRAAGYAQNGTITYGNIPTDSSPTRGDAYNCDVNNDGTFDPATERFYFIRKNDSGETDTAVLVHYTSFDETGQADSSTERKIYLYDAGKDWLPNSTIWSNPYLVSFDGKVSRYINQTDLIAACGDWNIDDNGYLDTCQYFMENSRFQSNTLGRSGIWIEKIDNTNHRIDTRTRKVSEVANDSSNSVRPVIEFSFTMIEGYADYEDNGEFTVDFDAHEGTASFTTKTVAAGSEVGELPTAEREGYIFTGWFTTPSGGVAITENTKITNDVTFHARYIIKHTVTFDGNGGTPSFATKEVGHGRQVGELPTATYEDHVLTGWYTDNTWATEVTETTVINNNETFVAKWSLANVVAMIEDEEFDNLASAVEAVPANGTKTTIKVMKNITLDDKIQIPSGKNIELDLQSYTIDISENLMFENSGTLHVKNGTLLSNAPENIPNTTNVHGVVVANKRNATLNITGGTLHSTLTNVIENAGTVTMTAGRLEANGNSAAINNNQYGVLTVSGGEIIATGTTKGQCIYNDKGTTTISGDVYIENTSQASSGSGRAAVHNNSGTVTITGGTIISNKNSAVKNNATMVIGTNDTTLDITSPVFRGDIYGLEHVSGKNTTIYDGIFKGVSAGINTPTAITHNSDVDFNTSGMDGTYHTAYLEAISLGSYTIELNPNGGSVTPTSVDVNVGDAVSGLPTPSKGVYTFDGWYQDSGLNTPVVEGTTVPTESTTYYAKWSYTANPNVVNFNMDNDAMSTYFSSVSTWLNNTSTFQTNMDNNFNNNSCFECNGPNYQSCPTPTANSVLCDQSLGYNTGVNAAVNVYESDEVNKTKGNLVSYTTSDTGVIYNMIPGETYLWELASDSNVYGYVKAYGTRRTIRSSVRNVRDLGGLSVTYTDGEGTHSGTIKYGILYRGAVINDSTGVTELSKLGINEEFDLRGNTSGSHISTYVYKSIVNYKFDDTASDRQDFRDAITMAMQDVVNQKKVFFHCAIGTDRTGTLAYFLEGLLGVSQEDKLEDYELSYFTGLLNRTRFHDNLSGSNINPRFTTMANTYDTNEKIYNWYINDPENQASDIQLVKDFRNAMINLD